MNSQLNTQPPRAHEVIEHHLRDLIATAAPGDRLPGDRELAEQFGVSRMTARQAVSTLVIEGRIHRVPGSGSFVAERPVHRRASRLLSFTEHMRRSGRQPSAVILFVGSRDGTREENDDLGQPLDSQVHLLRRLLLGDNVPIALEEVRLPESCQPVLEQDLATGSLHQALTEIGREPTRSRGTMTAESAIPDHAKLLDVAVGAALVVQRQIMMDANDVPVELVVSRFVGDRIVFHLDQEKHTYAYPGEREHEPRYVFKSLKEPGSPVGP